MVLHGRQRFHKIYPLTQKGKPEANLFSGFLPVFMLEEVLPVIKDFCSIKLFRARIKENSGTREWSFFPGGHQDLVFFCNPERYGPRVFCNAPHLSRVALHQPQRWFRGLTVLRGRCSCLRLKPRCARRHPDGMEPSQNESNQPMTPRSFSSVIGFNRMPEKPDFLYVF